MTKSSPSEAFPTRLKKAREARDLSQSELAEKAGLQASAISHFETETRRPSFANLRKLADALQVSTDYLLGRSDEMTGSGTADVMFRDIGALSEHDRQVIRDLAAQMAARKKKGEGGGKGT
jgi:transcriptional regulator with XRE-family HTH domain